MPQDNLGRMEITREESFGQSYWDEDRASQESGAGMKIQY